jgi:GNAT superfamily N-acetyltransferase
MTSNSDVTQVIRQAEVLTDVEKQKLFGWGDDIFGASSLELHWRPKDSHFLLYVDGIAVSHVGLLKHVVSVAGQPVTVGGVGGVVTVPEEQNRGHARELMQHATRLLADWRVDAGLLFCLKRMVPFYELQGWQVVNQPVLIEQPDGEINSPLEVMVLPLGGRPWPDGKVKLNSFPW